LADHLVEIDDLAVVSEDVPSIEVHVFPPDRTDLLDAPATSLLRVKTAINASAASI
jgi:hypothetical protein